MFYETLPQHKSRKNLFSRDLEAANDSLSDQMINDRHVINAVPKMTRVNY